MIGGRVAPLVREVALPPSSGTITQAFPLFTKEGDVMILDLSHFKPPTAAQLRECGCFRIFADDWAEFTRRHGSERVAADPLYALPEALRVALVEEVPNWFSQADLAFEMDLEILCRRHHAIGLFQNRPVGDVLLVPVSMRTEFFPALARSLSEEAATVTETQAAAEAGDDCMSPIHDRLNAYRGWLLTNPVFLNDVSQLRETWGDVVKMLGFFPAYGRLAHGRIGAQQPSGGRSIVTEGFARDWNTFYERWQLQRLLTWDLPEPLGPNLSGMAFPASVVRPPSQITIQLPATFALPNPKSLGSLVTSIQRTHQPEHLQGWQQVLDQRHPRGLRFQGFRQIFFLRFYRDIVLARRYPDRFRGRIAAIDRAFAAFLGEMDHAGRSLSEDAVKKLRQHIDRVCAA
jgi:hypothetical protein